MHVLARPTKLVVVRLPSDLHLGSTLPSTLLKAGLQLTAKYSPDELHRVPTDDGSSIALGRYLPRVPRRFVEPVILCHGLGANRFSLDLDEKYSLARYLAQRGYDAWVLELRGRGLAGICEDFTFDDQAQHDARAAIRTVLVETGEKNVAWVGHSKGGLVCYGHAGLNPDAPLKAVVAMGSPASFRAQPGLKKFIKTVGPLLKMKAIPTARLASLAIFGIPPGPISRYLIYESNAEPDIIKRVLYNNASNVSGGVARQFARWIETGNFDSTDGAFDYRKNMAALRAPLLLIAGTKDLMAPPLAVRAARDHAGGPVSYTVVGKAHGNQEDYGHGDLIVGRKAPEEIFPLVEEFLAQKLTAATAETRALR